MSSIKAWLYSSGRSAAAAAPASSSASSETPAKSDKSKQEEEEVVTSSLADMSEQSRAAAAGKAGEHFADMALGDGFGALVSFDSISSVPHSEEEGAVAPASEEIDLGAVDADADANANAHPPSDLTTS